MPFAPQSNPMKKRFASIRSLLSPGPVFPALARSGSTTWSSTPAARAAAEQSLAKAEALQPELPEIQLARANFGYFVLGDNKHVRDVLQQLHLIWPNNAEVIQLLAFTYQRLGEWQKAIDAFDQVIVLNPRYLLVRKFAAYTRCDVRDWPGAQRIRGRSAPDLAR